MCYEQQVCSAISAIFWEMQVVLKDCTQGNNAFHHSVQNLEEMWFWIYDDFYLGMIWASWKIENLDGLEFLAGTWYINFGWQKTMLYLTLRLQCTACTIKKWCCKVQRADVSDRWHPKLSVVVRLLIACKDCHSEWNWKVSEI
jgi:hypothetical protein